VTLQDLYYVDEVQNKAMKVERLQNKVLPFKNKAERISDRIRTQQNFTSNEWSLARKAIDATPANSTTKTAHTTKGKENLYAKYELVSVTSMANPDTGPMSDRKKRPVNMADYEDEDEVLIETGLEDSDFVKKEGEATTCVIQQLPCNQKNLTPHKSIRFFTQDIW